MFLFNKRQRLLKSPYPNLNNIYIEVHIMMKRILLSLGLCSSLLVYSATNNPSFAAFKDQYKDGLSARQLGSDMPQDVWAGLSYGDYDSLLSGLSSEFAHPIYRKILIDLMLAEHEGFDVPSEKQKQPLTGFTDVKYDTQNISEEQALASLKTRFDILYKLGAFDEAAQLYEELFGSKRPDDESLTLIGLYPLLISGNLSGFCLDLETIKSNEEYKRIQDLKNFCRLHFDKVGAETSETKEKDVDNSAENKATEEQPANDAAHAEQQELKTIENFSSLPALNILLQTDHSFSKEAFESASLIEKLLIHAMGRINAGAFNSYNNAPDEISSQSLKILSYQNASALPKQSCLMNEAYHKGVISAEALLLFYEAIPMATDSLDKDSFARKTLHDCQKTAWYIHYINQSNDDEERQSRKLESFKELSKYYPSFLNAYAKVFMDLNPSELSGLERWLLAESFIKEGIEVPSAWRESVRTNRENGIADSQESNSKVYILPDWYLQALQNPDFFDANEYFIWNQTGFANLPFSTSFAPSRPLTLLKTMLKLKLYEETLFQHYEKFFLLTFSRNYVIYSDSLISRVSAAIENEHTGKGMLLLLHMLSSQKPADVNPQYGDDLLDLLSRIGYKRYARHFIVDTLSVGKN